MSKLKEVLNTLSEKEKSDYVTNIEQDTLDNNYFRKVTFTGKGLQVALMTLQPGEDIGMEIHKNADQFFRIEEGEGELTIGDRVHHVEDGFAAVVPMGTQHNLRNILKERALKVYVLYSSPQDEDDQIDKTKSEAK